MKSQEIQALLSPLKTANIRDKDVGGLLQRIRSDAMATKGGFARLVKLGCVPILLKLLYRYLQLEMPETETEKAASENTVNTALSIVANLLMDGEAREQVNRHGMETIVNLLEQCASEEVKLRCCRSLSNMSMHSEIHPVMAEDCTVMALLKILDIEDTDAEYRSESPEEERSEPKFPSAALVDAACKTMRYGFNDYDVLQQLINKGVMRRLGALMKSEDSKLVAPVLKTLAELVTKSNDRLMEKVVSEFPRYGVMPKIMTLVDSENDKTSEQAFRAFSHLAEHMETAALIGINDGIHFILSHMDSSRSHISKGKLMTTLCVLARDAGNRDKLFCANLLKVFLETLEDQSFAEVHGRVVKGLHCFLYDQDSLTVLLEDGLVPALLTQLQRFGGFSSNLTINAFRSAESLLKSAAATVEGGNVSRHSLGSFGDNDALGENSVLERTLSEPTPRSTSFGVSQTCDAVTEGPPRDSAPSSEDPSGLRSQEERMEAESSGVDRGTSGGEGGDKSEPGPARTQMYSMNSPSYQAETTWHMEDYHPGVTCKSYHRALSPGSLSDSSGASPMTPHSPMSVQSCGSPSHSAQFSPLSSRGLSPYSSPSQGLSSPSTSGDCVSLWSSGEESPEQLTSVGVQWPRGSPAHQQDSMFSDTAAEQEVVFSSAEEDELTEGGKPGPSSDSSRPECSAGEDKLKSVRKVLFKADEEAAATSGQAPFCGKEDTAAAALSNNRSPVPDDRATVSSAGQTLENPGFKKTGPRFFEGICFTTRCWANVAHVHNKILNLLHQLSYRDDFEKYMTSYRVLLCLTDYLAISKSSGNWCVQILSHLMSSPHSLSNMLRMCAPAVLVRRLMLDSDQRLVRQASCETINCDSRTDWRAIHFNRRMAVEGFLDIGSLLLKDLSGAAMTSYGEGVILNIFSRLPEVQKLMCSASVLFLHKHWSPEWQQKFLIEKGALEKVLRALCIIPHSTDDTTVIKDVLGLALITLARDLEVAPRYPPADMAYFLKRAQAFTAQDTTTSSPSPGGSLQSTAGEDKFCHYSSVEKNLKIVVRDGDSRHVLHARRQMLADNSSVFNAMLQGGYLESRQSQILVDDVCVKAMTTVLHYLHCCDGRCPNLSLSDEHDWREKKKTTVQCRTSSTSSWRGYKRQATQPEPSDSVPLHDPEDAAKWLQHVMNVIVVADRYLLLDLVQYICAVMSASLENRDCVEEIFQFAVDQGLTELAEDCVRFLLCSPTSVAEITSRMAALAEGPYSSAFRNAVWSLLTRGIGPGVRVLV